MNAAPFLHAPTPERPGPGPLPSEALRALQIEVVRRLQGMLAGDYRSSQYGDGVELAQVRPYIPGDDVRNIEWNVTARMGEPHVRVNLAERVLVTWLLLDTSPSMQFGTADRRKADASTTSTGAPPPAIRPQYPKDPRPYRGRPIDSRGRRPS